MDTNVFPQMGQNGKSYWSKPEGKIGTIFGILALLGIGYFVLPYLTTILENWIHFAVTLAVAGALFYILVIDRRIFMAAKYMYDWFIKNVFGLVWRLDPFLIAEDYINDIKKERQNLETQITNVSGQKEETLATIKEQNKEKEKQLNIAAAALKKGMTAEMNIATAQARRHEEFARDLQPIADNLQKIEEYLEAVHTNSGYMLQDMENALSIKKAQYKAVTKGNNALKSAMATMKGNPDKRMLMEQSMDYLKEDIAGKLANMKYAIKQSSTVMKTIDLTNATMETEGLKMLQEYRPELFSYSETEVPVAIAETRTNSTKPITKYNDLLK